MLNNFPMGLTFDDVLLEPQESAVIRSEVDLSSFVTKKIKLQIPILAAAMDTVSEALMAIALGRLGGLAVLHRNCSVEEQLAMVRKVKKNKLLSSAAVGPGDLQRALALDKAGIDIIVVDTAHAHNLRALKSAKEIKKSVRAQIVVGNIGTKEAAMELVKFADAIKVGVGPGSICTTRVVAGIGVPQLTAILNVVEVAKKKGIPVIADGGIRYSGDAVKALAAGAQAVMLGSMLAGTKEAPGRVIKYNGELVKAYRGMGSFGAMQGGRSTDRYFQKNAKTHIPEGVEGITPYKGLVKDVVEQITGGMKSGMGYIGAKTIADMPKCARFIRITNAGLRESHPHTITINKKAPNY
ncbi:MAG: IMP dehydrogenase [Candidatus Doudnabacteria bacterium]|nr:IMP dehydrogenase [Candidatus Doudnabacteria bacterium]